MADETDNIGTETADEGAHVVVGDDPVPAGWLDDEGTDSDEEMTLGDMFGTDGELERRGIVIDYGKAGSFLVARAGGANVKYQQVLTKLTAPYRRQLRHVQRTVEGKGGKEKDVDQKSMKLLRSLQMQAFARAVVLGWSSERYGEGKIPHPFEKNEALEYNPDNCLWLLQQLPALFDDLQEQAMDIYNFRALEDEADAGN